MLHQRDGEHDHPTDDVCPDDALDRTRDRFDYFDLGLELLSQSEKSRNCAPVNLGFAEDRT